MPNWSMLSDDEKKVALEILYRRDSCRFHSSELKCEPECVIKEGVDEDRKINNKKHHRKKFDD